VVHDLVTRRAQVLLQVMAEVQPRVIGGDVDAHGR
jgi:hypothetical protein